MNSDSRRRFASSIQRISMFSIAFGVAGLSRELEHFHISKLGCLAIALVLAGLIAFPSFRATRWAAESIAGLRGTAPLSYPPTS
jgi:hypothetical protein